MLTVHSKTFEKKTIGSELVPVVCFNSPVVSFAILILNVFSRNLFFKNMYFVLNFF